MHSSASRLHHPPLSTPSGPARRGASSLPPGGPTSPTVMDENSCLISPKRLNESLCGVSRKEFDEDSDNEVQAKLEHHRKRMHEAVKSLEESFVDNVVCHSLEAWFTTTLSFMDDNEATAEIERLCDQVDNDPSSILHPPPMVQAEDDTFSGGLQAGLRIYQRDAMRARAKLEELQSYYSELRNDNMHLEEEITTKQDLTESIVFDRQIGFEIPLAMRIFRPAKEYITIEFWSISPDPFQTYACTINIHSKTCSTRPYCREVEEIWAGQRMSEIDHNGFMDLILMTRKVIKYHFGSESSTHIPSTNDKQTSYSRSRPTESEAFFQTPRRKVRRLAGPSNLSVSRDSGNGGWQAMPSEDLQLESSRNEDYSAQGSGGGGLGGMVSSLMNGASSLFRGGTFGG